MTKIVYNACFGGFGLSHAAIKRYAELKGINLYAFVNNKLIDSDTEAEQASFVNYYITPDRADNSYFSCSDIERTDPLLVQVVEELGTKANTRFSALRITEIPVGSKYRIDEYDGNESVETPDSYEWSIA